MIRLFIITIGLLTMTIGKGQPPEIKNFMSHKQMTDLRNTLYKNLEDSTRIRTLLRLAKYYFEEGLNTRSFLDSAAQYIKNAKEINGKHSPLQPDALILLYEASLARRRGNYTLGRLLIAQVVKKLETSKDHFHLAEAYLELSHCYDPGDPKETPAIKKAFNSLFKVVPINIKNSEQDSCMSILMNDYALELSHYNNEIRSDFLGHLARSYQLLNDKVHELWTRKEQADVHYQQGNLIIAINELLQIVNEQKEGGYPGICFSYDLLSGLYYADADYNKSLFYSLMTIRNVKTAIDSSYLSVFYTRISASYNLTGSVAEALEWSLKSLNYLIAHKQLGAIYNVMHDVSGYLITLKRAPEAIEMVDAKRKKYPPRSTWERNFMLQSLAEAYSALHQYAIAEKYCDELIQLNQMRLNQKDTDDNIYLDQFLAYFYFDEGKFNKAEKYFKKTVKEWPKSARDIGVRYQSNFLFKLDSARGNYLSAIRHLHTYQAIQDSLQTAVKTKQIEELKVAYQTEQKDSLINLTEQNMELLTKQDQLQKNQLRQGATLRNIGFAAAALMIIIIGLLYNRYRLKQRTNKQLELQQSEITKQNASLRHLVNEKDWLVKEIHHRVKNNLQIVMSLLNSQSLYIDNQFALTAIHDSQHRVHAMSLIHQKLYNTENVSSIDMSLYIREMVSYLSESFNIGQRIRFQFDIESLETDVSQAVPLGLILNEAITNAIKYAFPENTTGVISISLSNTSPYQYLLVISDNGVGIPQQLSSKKPSSLGMSLMEGLSEDLDGKFSIESKDGTTIKVSFAHDVNVKRPDVFAAPNVSNN